MQRASLYQSEGFPADMTTKASKNKARNKISGVESSEGSASTLIDKGSSADGRSPVFVRISQRALEVLNEASKAPLTRGMVIDALLRNFDKVEDEGLRRKILKGQIFDPLKEHGALLELRSWAEHAFQNGRYVWAGGMYEMLAKHASSSEGLKNICNYRLSVCLIRLSYEIREEALGKPGSPDPIDKNTYELALETLEKAMEYTTTLQGKLGAELGFPKLVLYYNLASCHSLKAQYAVEMELDLRTKRGQDSIHYLRLAGRNEELMERAWVDIGQNWRDSTNEKRLADSEADKALKELVKILPISSDEPGDLDVNQLEDRDLLSEKMALVDSALTDEDFIFLRSDTQKKVKFKAWASLVTGRKPTADAVRALLERSSQSIPEDHSLKSS
jgi:hypothetical protein